MRFSKMLPLLAVLATPAFAQDGSDAATRRTPATAQQFLIMVAPGRVQYYTKDYQKMNPQVRGVSSADACSTTIELEPMPDLPATFTFDWTKVQAVARDEKTGWIAITSAALDPARFPNKFVEVAFLSTESAMRGLAAMQFLRTACDKAAETGF